MDVQTRTRTLRETIPRRITFTIHRDNKLVSTVMRRAGENVHVRITDGDSTRDFTFKSLGDPELDRRAVFVLSIIASRLGDFKFNSLCPSPLCKLKKQLEDTVPDLVGDSSPDAILTEYFALHTPVPQVLPAGAVYVEKVAEIVREKDNPESVYYPKYYDPIAVLNYVYGLADDACQDDTGIRLCVETIMLNALAIVYGNDKLLENEKLIVELGPPEDYFRAEHVYVAIKNFDLFSLRFNRLMRQARPWNVLPSLKRVDSDTYRVTVVLGDPENPTARISSDLQVVELARLLKHVSVETSKTGVLTSILTLLSEKEETALVDREKKIFLVAEPGRTVIIEGGTGGYTVSNRYEHLKTHLEDALDGKPVEFPYKILTRPGPGFYGSETLKTAVGITGCLTCKQVELVNNRLALARHDKGWIAGILVPNTDMAVRMRGRTARSAILRLTRFLIQHREALAGVEKHAPEILALSRVLDDAIPELYGHGACKTLGLTVRSRPVYTTAYAVYSIIGACMDRIYTIGLLAVAHDDDVEDRTVEDGLLGSVDYWSVIPKPEKMEEIVSYGFEKLRETDAGVLFRNGSIYLIIPRPD